MSADSQMCSKNLKKREFCIEIKGAKLAFLKNSGYEISVLQNLSIGQSVCVVNVGGGWLDCSDT